MSSIVGGTSHGRREERRIETPVSEFQFTAPGVVWNDKPIPGLQGRKRTYEDTLDPSSYLLDEPRKKQIVEKPTSDTLRDVFKPFYADHRMEIEAEECTGPTQRASTSNQRKQQFFDDLRRIVQKLDDPVAREALERDIGTLHRHAIIGEPGNARLVQFETTNNGGDGYRNYKDPIIGGLEKLLQLLPSKSEAEKLVKRILAYEIDHHTNKGPADVYDTDIEATKLRPVDRGFSEEFARKYRHPVIGDDKHTEISLSIDPDRGDPKWDPRYVVYYVPREKLSDDARKKVPSELQDCANIPIFRDGDVYYYDYSHQAVTDDVLAHKKMIDATPGRGYNAKGFRRLDRNREQPRKNFSFGWRHEHIAIEPMRSGWFGKCHDMAGNRAQCLQAEAKVTVGAVVDEEARTVEFDKHDVNDLIYALVDLQSYHVYNKPDMEATIGHGTFIGNRNDTADGHTPPHRLCFMTSGRRPKTYEVPIELHSVSQQNAPDKEVFSLKDLFQPLVPKSADSLELHKNIEGVQIIDNDWGSVEGTKRLLKGEIQLHEIDDTGNIRYKRSTIVIDPSKDEDVLVQQKAVRGTKGLELEKLFYNPQSGLLSSQRGDAAKRSLGQIDLSLKKELKRESIAPLFNALLEAYRTGEPFVGEKSAGLQVWNDVVKDMTFREIASEGDYVKYELNYGGQHFGGKTATIIAKMDKTGLCATEAYAFDDFLDFLWAREDKVYAPYAHREDIRIYPRDGGSRKLDRGEIIENTQMKERGLLELGADAMVALGKALDIIYASMKDGQNVSQQYVALAGEDELYTFDSLDAMRKAVEEAAQPPMQQVA